MATIDIPDKICPHCGGIRWVEQRRHRKGINDKTVYYSCAKRMNEIALKYQTTPAGREANRKIARRGIKELKRKYILDQLAIFFLHLFFSFLP